MNKLVQSFILLTISCLISLEAAQPSNGRAITWITSYEEAVNQSKDRYKPILLFFTGSDWCSWCHKLEKEVLDTQEFALSNGDQFIFVKLDFPLNRSLPRSETSQNKELQRKYDVRSFPTIVILDPQQRQIGVTGYRPGGAKAYGDHLEKIVNDYTTYQEKVKGLEKNRVSSIELKQMYLKAKELGRLSEGMQIVNAGMKNRDNLFFMIERYRFLADEGQLFDEETIQLRKAILDSDPYNKKQTHYHIAVIDFEAACEEMEKENFSPEIAVAPLVSYIERFGKQDPDHLWRLQMIISQIFLDKGKLPDALKYARASLNAAPEPSRPEIGLAIRSIEYQMAHY